jgi:hypothetical protein
MEPNKQAPTSATNEQDATEQMKLVVAEYDLPESYQRLVNGPWRLVAQTVLQQFGEDSDAWSRMTWFTRILCTAIETSLNRHTPDAVNDALNGFSIWLNSLREEGDAYSMCVSAANYAQRRISGQITEDTAQEQEQATNESDDEFVLPGADALDMETLPTLEEEPVPELGTTSEAADEPLEETIAETLETTHDDAFDSLSLSLAYSANESAEDQQISPEQPNLPDTTERGIDMETQPKAVAEESQIAPAETHSTPGTAAPVSDRLTDAASISPVPMGAWLAFHDQDMPTLARLAMYDTADEAFMLGNRNGILVRKIAKTELNGLIDSGLVQLVEFQSIS